MESARHVARHPRIVVTDIEAQLGTVFTEETIAALQRRFPHLRFVWLMGSDNLLQIPRWKNWQRIFQALPVAVVARPGSALQARTGIAMQQFRSAETRADARFANRRPPALALLDARRNPQSATRLRAAQKL
jgi:nicotinate-nucleotide adenylyltransferase